MVEGFDVGLEMSGTPPRSTRWWTTWPTAGRIAMLGIPDTEIAIDWHQVVFNMLTIKGIYGREMYETWYQMTVMLQSGLDVKPVITHRFPWNEFERAFAVAGSVRAARSSWSGTRAWGRGFRGSERCAWEPSSAARAGSSRAAPGISAFAVAAPRARQSASSQPRPASSPVTRPARKASPLPTG